VEREGKIVVTYFYAVHTISEILVFVSWASHLSYNIHIALWPERCTFPHILLHFERHTPILSQYCMAGLLHRLLAVFCNTYMHFGFIKSGF
jgi:hypothetical protein